MAYRGKFRPNHPEKYVGNVNNIIWRSLWELKFLRWLDRTESVIQYSSEEVIIPYISPLDGLPHRYFPDFWFKVRGKDGKHKKHLVEIKPSVQTRPPKIQNRITPKYLTEVKTWGVNEAKWEAAEAFCREVGWTFHKITEKDLNIPLNTPYTPKRKVTSVRAPRKLKPKIK